MLEIVRNYDHLVPFGALTTRSLFCSDGALWLKIVSSGSDNAIDLNDGCPAVFDPDALVRPVRGRLEVYEK